MSPHHVSLITPVTPPPFSSLNHELNCDGLFTWLSDVIAFSGNWWAYQEHARGRETCGKTVAATFATLAEAYSP